jgi:hypothetical protein
MRTPSLFCASERQRQPFQIIEVQRFGKKGRSTFLQTFIARIACRVGGHHNHTGRRRARTNFFEQGDAVNGVHLDVDDGRGEILLRQQLKSLVAAVGGADRVTLAAKNTLEQHQKIVFVIDQENRICHDSAQPAFERSWQDDLLWTGAPFTSRER